MALLSKKVQTKIIVPATSGTIIRLTLPLYVILPRKTKKDRKVWLNLNSYRNTHHHVLADMKREYAKMIQTEINSIPDGLKPPFIFTYRLFIGSPSAIGHIDISNPLCIIDKFVCDAIVSAGKLTNDTYEFIPKVNYRFGGVDKTNPRCELEIIPCGKAE